MKRILILAALAALVACSGTVALAGKSGSSKSQDRKAATVAAATCSAADPAACAAQCTGGAACPISDPSACPASCPRKGTAAADSRMAVNP